MGLAPASILVRRFGGLVLGICAVFLLLQELFLRSTELRLIQVADELFLAGILLYIFFKAVSGHKLRRVELYVIGSLSFLTVVSFLGVQPDGFKVFAQTIIHFTFFLFYIWISEIREKENCGANCLHRIVRISVVLAITGFSVNVVGQEAFLRVFNVEPLYRYGLLRIEGFQLKPNDLAIFFALAFTFISFRLAELNRVYALVSVTITFVILELLTGSRIGLMGIAVSFILLFFGVRRSNVRTAMFSMLIICAPSILLVFGPSIIEQTISDAERTMQIENSTYIRGIMVYYGFLLMLEYFPIGSGAATFGSTLSRGSPVYESLGIDTLEFFTNFWGIYDSNVATVAGEFGLFGVAIFMGLMAVIYRRESETASPLRKKYIQAIFVILIGASFTNPTFMYQHNGFFFALFICSSLLIGNGKSSPGIHGSYARVNR